MPSGVYPRKKRLKRGLCRLKNHVISVSYFEELQRMGFICEYTDHSTGSTYFGLKPDARRELHQLGPSYGPLSDGQKMTTKTPSEWVLEIAPGGRTLPVPERELTSIQEVQK